VRDARFKRKNKPAGSMNSVSIDKVEIPYRLTGGQTGSKVIRNVKSGRAAAMAGSSLAELIVAAFLVSLSIAAVVAVIGAGSQLTASDTNRRQARSIVRSVIEEHYDCKNFSAIPENLSRIDSVEITPREGCTLRGAICERVESSTVVMDNGIEIPVRNVTVVISWNESTGTADSIKLVKKVAQI
jgi:hypothetical protein